MDFSKRTDVVRKKKKMEEGFSSDGIIDNGGGGKIKRRLSLGRVRRAARRASSLPHSLSFLIFGWRFCAKFRGASRFLHGQFGEGDFFWGEISNVFCLSREEETFCIASASYGVGGVHAG